MVNKIIHEDENRMISKYRYCLRIKIENFVILWLSRIVLNFVYRENNSTFCRLENLEKKKLNTHEALLSYCIKYCCCWMRIRNNNKGFFLSCENFEKNVDIFFSLFPCYVVSAWS